MMQRHIFKPRQSMTMGSQCNDTGTNATKEREIFIRVLCPTKVRGCEIIIGRLWVLTESIKGEGLA